MSIDLIYFHTDDCRFKHNIIEYRGYMNLKNNFPKKVFIVFEACNVNVKGFDIEKCVMEDISVDQLAYKFIKERFE